MIRPHQCPICDKPFQPSESAGESHFPFCSKRCRQVDLFRWFDGKYAVVEELDPQVAEILRHDPDIEVDESA